TTRGATGVWSNAASRARRAKLTTPAAKLPRPARTDNGPGSAGSLASGDRSAPTDVATQRPPLLGQWVGVADTPEDRVRPDVERSHAPPRVRRVTFRRRFQLSAPMPTGERFPRQR